MSAYEEALAANPALAKYGSNAILLIALQLRLRVEDIESIASDALTDGHDDKKCDLVYVDPEEGVAVVAQGYLGQQDKPSAPANKASDLNTAVAWLLNRPINELPERLQPSADRLRDALQSNQIRELHIWYVHNLPESANVKNEMETAAHSAKMAVSALNEEAEVEVSGVEVGRNILEEWYQSAQAPILVTKAFEVIVPGGYEIRMADWEAYVTAVPAKWLYDLYKEHGVELFSANVRGYLGYRKSDRNINFGIRETAQSDPSHFWTFNNGITALVHGFEPPKNRRKPMRLKISGLSVVNGAQTTGAVGTLPIPPSNDAMVPARFVRCNDPKTIRDIIRYNNSQNRVTAPDFRSNDAVQQRLRREFGTISGAGYTGGRRGGEEDTVRHPASVIPSETAGQALAAFHGDPALAYNGKSEIWESNPTYSRFFNERTTANHIVFCYSLLRAINTRKRELIEKSNSTDPLTDIEQRQLSYLRKRGANFLLVAAIAKCLETFVGHQIPNLFYAGFGQMSPVEAERTWKPIVVSTLPFCNQLTSAFDFSLKSSDKVPTAIDAFRSLVEATKHGNQALFEAFAAKIRAG